MFKAKMIENDSYYQLRRKQLLYFLLPLIPLGIIVNYYQISLWAAILFGLLYIAANILYIRNSNKLNSLLSNRTIEIDEKQITIKTKNSQKDEIILLDNIDKLILKNTYSIPQESLKEVGMEIAGKSIQNFLIIEQNGQKRKLDFEVESYYMINQLNKLIDIWKTKGINIERIEN